MLKEFDRRAIAKLVKAKKHKNKGKKDRFNKKYVVFLRQPVLFFTSECYSYSAVQLIWKILRTK